MEKEEALLSFFSNSLSVGVKDGARYLNVGIVSILP